MMKYTSTRSSSISCSFEDAVCSGYAPDGGLFVPESLPRLTRAQMVEWSTWSYAQVCQAFLRLFIDPDEVSDECLQHICASSFGIFEDPDHVVVPVRKLGNVFMAELYHGPTFCFKDLGMRVVVHLLSHFCTQRQRRMTLLVSTTGDTGPAAVRAVSDIANNPLLSILVHYPQGQISHFQRKQMTTVRSPLVKVVAFQGGGDDMDTPIKRILTTTTTINDQRNHMVCGVNSYNIGRPLVQAVHYVWTYLRVMEQLGKQPGDPNIQLDMVVPTGAMGNLAGGYMAKKMGLPLGKLCAVVNLNDITHRTFQGGEFYKSPGMVKTLSEAINVQVPYNFERLLFYLTNGDHNLVQEWMTTMDQSSQLKLDGYWLDCLQAEFQSERVSDDEMCQTIRNVYHVFQYISDPHTAVALCGAIKLRMLILNNDLDHNLSMDKEKMMNDVNVAANNNDNHVQTCRVNPVAVLATASPCKFQEAMTTALGQLGWESYMEHDFPSQARAILNQTEIDPIVFDAATEGQTFQEMQAHWEVQARHLLKELGLGTYYW